MWEVRAGMRQERSIPSIEIGSQGEKLSDFVVSPAVTQSTFMYPSLPLSPSIMCSPCFAKVFSSLSFSSFTLYPRTCLCLVADVGTSLANQEVHNCWESIPGGKPLVTPQEGKLPPWELTRCLCVHNPQTQLCLCSAKLLLGHIWFVTYYLP